MMTTLALQVRLVLESGVVFLRPNKNKAQNSLFDDIKPCHIEHITLCDDIMSEMLLTNYMNMKNLWNDYRLEHTAESFQMCSMLEMSLMSRIYRRFEVVIDVKKEFII